jgi:spermidine export protein MdtJ
MRSGAVTLVFAILLNALANILMKVGMSRVGKTSGLLPMLRHTLRQPALWGGLVSFGLALGAYSLVLTKMNLSVAYPVMVSMGLIVVVLASAFLLMEPVSAVQIIGFGLIIAGVWMVAR